MTSDRIRLNHETLVAAVGNNWPPAQVDAAIELLTSNGRFPHAARKLPPDLISAIQRERLLVAMLRAVAELGYREASVQAVLDRAGISRPTFYDHFSNREDCFLTAFDAASSRLKKRIDEAATGGGNIWRDRLRLGLEELLRFCREQPDDARVLIVESRGATQTALQRRDELLEHFSNLIESQAQMLVPDPFAHSALTAAGIVGGIEALLFSRLSRGELASLPSLLPSLMYFAVLPYEGPKAAGEEFTVAAG